MDRCLDVTEKEKVGGGLGMAFIDCAAGETIKGEEVGT